MIKDEDNYYVMLDESPLISEDQKSKIKEISCEYPESKIPFTEIYRDMYFLSDKIECEAFIERLDEDIQELFKIERFHKNNLKYTAFLDILGFSNYMETKITNVYEAEEFYNKLSQIKEYLNWIKEATLKTGILLLGDVHIKHSWISDTFIITIENDKDIENGADIKSLMLFILAQSIAFIHHFMAENYGLLLRGGISSKYVCITDNLILGKGISESAKLEKDIAVYPRVIFEQSIIDDEIYEMISKKYQDNDLNYISKDCDGYYFINYLGLLQELPPMINSIPMRDSNKYIPQSKINILVKDNLHQKEGIRQKYKWLDEYLKKVCSNEEFKTNIK